MLQNVPLDQGTQEKKHGSNTSGVSEDRHPRRCQHRPTQRRPGKRSHPGKPRRGRHDCDRPAVHPRAGPLPGRIRGELPANAPARPRRALPQSRTAAAGLCVFELRLQPDRAARHRRPDRCRPPLLDHDRGRRRGAAEDSARDHRRPLPVRGAGAAEQQPHGRAAPGRHGPAAAGRSHGAVRRRPGPRCARVLVVLGLGLGRRPHLAPRRQRGRRQAPADRELPSRARPRLAVVEPVGRVRPAVQRTLLPGCLRHGRADHVRCKYRQRRHHRSGDGRQSVVDLLATGPDGFFPGLAARQPGRSVHLYQRVEERRHRRGVGLGRPRRAVLLRQRKAALAGARRRGQAAGFRRQRDLARPAAAHRRHELA